MAKRLVAADASPLIGLAAAGAFDLLHDLFGNVTISRAVRDEVMAGGELPGAAELAAAIETGWIKVVRNPSGMGRLPELDAGEASTLALAFKHQGECLVLMDELAGRAHAREHGITVTGLAGILVAAKRARLVKRIQPFFDRLDQSDFRISPDLVRAVMEDAGEL